MRKTLLAMCTGIAGIVASDGQAILLDFNRGTSTTATAANFTAAGATGLAGTEAVGAISVVQFNDANTLFTASTGQTVTFSTRAQGSYSINQGNPLLDDYIYLEQGLAHGGPITVNVGNVGLPANATYTLYVWGNNTNADQLSAFTPVNNAGITFASTATDSDGLLTVQFTTAAGYAGESVDFIWARAATSPNFAGMNGIAIVPSAPAIPQFVTQPASFIGAVGDPVSLTSGAVSSPAPGYQWQYSADGLGGWTNITDANSTTLSFASVLYADNGYYRVLASNANGSSTSDVASIDVAYPAPFITGEPSSKVAYEGSEVVLSVVATTLDAAQYQWYRGFSGDTSNPIAGETSDTLVLSNIQESAEGEYWVRVTDPAATADSLPATTADSAAATVEVLPPRDGMVVLLDINSNQGGFASSDALPADFTAAGVPDLTAADEVSVSAPQPITQVTAVSFSGGQSLALSGAGAFGAWSVNNGSGLLNDYLFLQNGTANPGPTTLTLSDLNLEADTSYTLYVFGKGSDTNQDGLFTPVPSANVTYQSTAPVAGILAVNFTTAAGYSNDPLTIDWARSGSNTYASLNGFAIVPVNLPGSPSFVVQPGAFSGFVGETVTLTAGANGSPFPTYQWQRSADGTGGWTNVSGATAETLSFAPAAYADRGYYRVTASNSNGSSTSDVAQVDLTYPDPVITAQPSSDVVYAGSEVTLTVSATALGTPEFQWYKGNPGDTSQPVSGATGDTLVMPNIQIADAGEFWVRVTDPAATADSLPATTADSAAATVEVLPPRDGMVVLLDINSNQGGFASSDALPADFTAAGVPDLTAADEVSVSAPQPITQVTAVSFSGGQSLALSGSGAFGAWSVNNGSGLLNDYLFLQDGTANPGPTTLTLSDLNLEADTSYTLYVFGKGENASQDGVFTPVPSTHVTYQSTASVAGILAVSFTTAAGYSNDPLVIDWARGGTNTYAALNGFAIVPGSLPADDFAAWIAGYPGVGSLTGFDDDADGDGLSNGVENYLGTDPGVANPGLTEVSKAGAALTFRHSQNATPASDVVASYRWSTDLANFHDGGATSGGTTVTFLPASDTPVAGTTTVTANIAGTVPGKLFVILEAQQNP